MEYYSEIRLVTLPCHRFFCNWFRSEEAFLLVVCTDVAVIIDLGLIPEKNGDNNKAMFQGEFHDLFRALPSSRMQ